MRRVSFAQVVTSVLVVLVLAYGLWLRTPPTGTTSVLRELSEGAPDGEARQALLSDLLSIDHLTLVNTLPAIFGLFSIVAFYWLTSSLLSLLLMLLALRSRR